MGLFTLPEKEELVPESDKTLKVKGLKKGDSIDTLINQARQLVMEKLGNYKDTSSNVFNVEELDKFFNETEDIIAIDTETTGLNWFTDELVGISMCNGTTSIYIPINHKSPILNERLKIQLEPNVLKGYFKEKIKALKNIKWVYHNAKFDLGVLRTFLEEPMPDPYWDTMLCSNLLDQDEEHSLKFQYNKYIAEEDEGVNRFDTLFKGITFDYIPLDVAVIYAGKDAFMTYKLFKWQYERLHTKEYESLLPVLMNVEMPLLPILEDMQRTGVNINMNMLNELYEKYKTKLDEAKAVVEQEIQPYVEAIRKYKLEHYNVKLDDPINISSPLQLGILFYDIIGYKVSGRWKRYRCT